MERTPVPSPEAWSRSPAYSYPALQEELDGGEPCFVFTICQFFLERITLEVYFDHLLKHLRIDGPRHRFDTARRSTIGELFRMDLIAAAIKSWMLSIGRSDDLEPLSEAEVSQLKHLCLLAYRADTPDALREGATEAETPLDSLPPRWVNLLAVIAYARCHLDVLQHLLTYTPLHPKSTFDLLTPDAISSRKSIKTERFAHCPAQPTNRACRLSEMRHWTVLLQSPWLHRPLLRGNDSLTSALQQLLDFKDDPSLRSHSDTAVLCRALSAAGVSVTSEGLSRLLSIETIAMANKPTRALKPCSLALATLFLECFPLASVAAAESKNGQGKKLGPSSAATILLPITQWSKSNRDRLAVMRLLLESGCDPNGVINSDSRWEGYCNMVPAGWRRRQYDAPLHQAAERGDDQMVKLLLEFGAKRDKKSAWWKDTPEERAEKFQRFGTAKVIRRGG